MDDLKTVEAKVPAKWVSWVGAHPALTIIVGLAVVAAAIVLF